MSDDRTYATANVSRLNLFGRRKLYISESEITEDNIISILKECLLYHTINSDEIRYLKGYYKGKQPILNKEKTLRPEINHKVVRNHALQVVDFHGGNTFAEPIQYVLTNTKEGGYNENIADLNRLMNSAFKPTRDRELGETLVKTGIAHRYIRSNFRGGGVPFKTTVLNSENTFVAYTNTIDPEPALGVSYVYVDPYANNAGSKQVTAYTRNKVYNVTIGGVGEENSMRVSNNPLGEIPIIEYELNPSRMGQFEPVITIMDAINTIESNRVDGIEQFVQALLKFKDCDVEEEKLEKLHELGAIFIKTLKDRAGGDADVEYMVEELSQSETQVAVDNLYQQLLNIVGVPDRQMSSGGNTGQAIIIGQGWQSANNVAESIELMFREPEYLFLSIVLKILGKSTEEKHKAIIENITLTDLNIKFTRSKTFNLLVKTQGLLNLLAAGIHPNIAIRTVDLFPDSEEVYEESKDFMKKWITDTGKPANNIPDPPDAK